MKRWFVLISLLLVVGAAYMACHHARRSGGGGADTTPGAVQVPDEDAALAAANDHIEAARILSLPTRGLPAGTMRGMALPTYTELPDLSYEQMVGRVKATGATHVSIVVSWDQQTIYHNRIAPDPSETPSDERFAAVIRAAHAADLGVLLFPIIHVERRNEGEWRGKLAPTVPERWKQDYRAYIMRYADLAEATGVEILSVGSELSSMEGDTVWWRELIADVRKRYSGKVLYSANWDHFETPQFWAELDYVGVSSYFEVAKRPDEPMFKVTNRWLEHRRQLTDFARSVGKPLVLTEVGYPSTSDAAVKPWDYTKKLPPNPNAQLAAFRSLSETWSRTDDAAPFFAGLFIWHAWGHGGPEDISYPVWGKSSERFIRQWYSAPTP